MKNTLIRRAIVGLQIALLGCASAGAAEEAESARILSDLRGEFSSLRLEEKDLTLPKGFVPPLTLPFIEKLFESPLDIFPDSQKLARDLGQAANASDLFEAASAVLGNDPDAGSLQPASGKIPTFPLSTPETLKPFLTELYQDLTQARLHLKKSSRSISKKDQDNFTILLNESDISSRRMKDRFDRMKKFDQASLLRAGSLVFKQIDRIIAVVKENPDMAPLEWKTRMGTILIKGQEDNTYTEKDLLNVVVLIDLGGHNTYETPVGAAGAGEIRIAVDFGNDITINGPSHGSGIFGIGALIGPNPDGIKKLSAGSFSQGCGIGGIGALLLNGPVELEGDRYVQGAGAMGIGILSVRHGNGSRFSAIRAAQGVGLVKGAGVFVFEGNNTDISGGLVEPDPREPLGAVSLCQGVGFGHRAYSGGGVGACILKGDRINVTGSYFAQGSGYWHGLGLFQLQGNESVLKARRYDQGAGVHFAFGYFGVEGNKNKILNWGVGPAYGWDRGLGSAVIHGSDNTIQAEWGTGTASIGGLSFSHIDGDRNKFQLPQYGNGSIYRDEFGYSIHVIKGQNNLMKGKVSWTGGRLRLMNNPWGILKLSSVELDPTLNLEPIVWGDLPAGRDLGSEQKNMGTLLSSRKIADLIDVAAAFSTDKETPRRALASLLSLHDNDVPEILNHLRPESVDQMIQIRIALAAFGSVTSKAILKKLDSVEPNTKNILLNFLDSGPAADSIPALLKILNDRSASSQQARAALILGRIYNRDTGNEPGLRAALEKMDDPALLERVTFFDGFGLLSKLKKLTKEDRLRFLAEAPKDLTETLGQKTSSEFLRQINESSGTAKSVRDVETKTLDGYEREIRSNIVDLLQSTAPRTAAAALIALGQIGNPADASLMPIYMNHSRAVVREAAAMSLNRMGLAGLRHLERMYKAGNVIQKRTVIASLTNAVVEEAGELILKGLQDNDSTVRLTAVSVLLNLSPALEKSKPQLLKKAEERIQQEKSDELKLALKLLRP